MAVLKAKEQYPVSQNVIINGDIVNNELSLSYPESPTITATEIKLFESSKEFFKTDHTKNLRDDMFYKKVILNIFELPQKITKYFTFKGVINSVKPVVHSCLDQSACYQSTVGNFPNNELIFVSKELEEAFLKAILGFFKLELRIQDRIVYKNDLYHIKYIDNSLNFKLRGIDDLDARISIDNRYKDYLSLKDIMILNSFKTEAMQTEDTGTKEFITVLINEFLKYTDTYKSLLNVQLDGYLTTVQGTVKR